MAATQKIVDFDDLSFDPFKTIDQQQGVGEVDDPYPQLHAMLSKGSIQEGDMRRAFGMQPFPFWTHYPSWMVFSHDAVTRVFTDGATFSNSLWQSFYDDSFGASINGMDAPDHPRYRRLFQKAFMPQTVARWGKLTVPRAIDPLIDAFVDRGTAELVSEFTALFPFNVIYEQLHLPHEDRAIFQKLAVGITCLGIDHAHALEASIKMGNYFALLLSERKLEPVDHSVVDDDLIRMLATAEIDGEGLPEIIAVSFLRQLMAAAGDTTYRVSGSLLAGLLAHPDQLEAVRADRSLVPKAVEEALRWEPPITFGSRLATRDAEIDGVVIPAGAKVDVVHGTANRDPALFDMPDNFDIFRSSGRHTTFATGPHVCIGQHLARLELSHALNALLDRLPNLRLDPAYPAPRILGLSSRSPDALHVLFDPA